MKLHISRKIKQYIIFLLFLIGLIIIIYLSFYGQSVLSTNQKLTFWQFKSIDTMKYSRDLSREKLNDPSFNTTIDQQIKDIANTGATYVAIDTPYDEEFMPILQQWIRSTRRNHLHVWFRGNWSGWEGWFDYPKIDRTTHIQKTEQFILSHPDLFQDGDIFSACPECENGGPGDPRMTGDVEGHRKFLIDEYNVTKATFKKIHKNVASNYNSMNGDVARLVMDKQTTKALDGIVVIDHYVRTPTQLASDIENIAQQSGGKVILGEFGAPIPDLNGDMTEEEQATWLHDTFNHLVNINVLIGVNYWTNIGSSTALWNDDGTPKQAVEEIKKVFNPTIVKIIVKNALGQNIASTVTSGDKSITAENGQFSIMYLNMQPTIEISANGYKPKQMAIEGQSVIVLLEKQNEDPIFKFEKSIVNLFHSR